MKFLMENWRKYLGEARGQSELKVGDMVELEIKQAGDDGLSRLKGEVRKVVRHEKGWVKGYTVFFFDRFGSRLKTFPRSKLTLADDQESLELPQDARHRDLYDKVRDVLGNTQLQEVFSSWRYYLNEAKFDKETTLLSRSIVNAFKSKAGEGASFKTRIPVPPELEQYLDQVVVEFKFASYAGSSRIEGEYGYRELSMVVEIGAQDGADPLKSISSWLGELKGTIRHELEHSIQDSRGELDDWEEEELNFENIDDLLDYYYDPVEVEAFAAEIYKRAKTEKRLASELVNDRIDKFAEEAEDFVYLGDLSEDELERHMSNIKDSLVHAIKKRFPKAQLDESIELDIEIGDVVLGGKYKNKRIVVKDIGKDELGQPTINGKPILKFRIEKFLPDEKKSRKTLDAEKEESEE
jgi:hypothetical protein